MSFCRVVSTGIWMHSRGTPILKIYSELGLESLQNRKLCTFYKILNSMSRKYLSEIIPSFTRRYVSRNANSILLVRVNNNYFMNNFFLSKIIEWNIPDLSIHNSTSLIYLRALYFILQNMFRSLHFSSSVVNIQL